MHILLNFKDRKYDKKNTTILSYIIKDSNILRTKLNRALIYIYNIFEMLYHVGSVISRLDIDKLQG